MTNTHPRAHVASPTITPASPVDPVLENHQTSDDESDQQINRSIAPQLNRKARRREKKLRAAAEQEALSVELDNSSEATVRSTTASDDESDEEEDTVDGSLSRKQRKKLEKQRQKREKQQKQRIDEASPTQSTEPSTSTLQPPTPNPNPIPPPTLLRSISPNPTMPPPAPLLICSLGNPGPQYAQTLHSAGHIILQAIRERGLYLPFKRGLSGLVSTPNNTNWKYHLIYGFQRDGTRPLKPGEDDFTLWQSTKMMNVSGPSVKSAWREWSAGQRASNAVEGRLVVVHDELESALGKITVREGSASARGHNGLKSCQAALAGKKWWRVGVGIGRPESREPDAVAKYVLTRMNYVQEKAMDQAAVGVLRALRGIAEGNP